MIDERSPLTFYNQHIDKKKEVDALFVKLYSFIQQNPYTSCPEFSNFFQCYLKNGKVNLRVFMSFNPDNVVTLLIVEILIAMLTPLLSGLAEKLFDNNVSQERINTAAKIGFITSLAIIFFINSAAFFTLYCKCQQVFNQQFKAVTELMGIKNCPVNSSDFLTILKKHDLRSLINPAEKQDFTALEVII